MRIREVFTKTLAPDGSDYRDIVLEAGQYIFNRVTSFGVTETFVADAVLDPGGANEEYLLSVDVPFDYLFQKNLTLTQNLTLRLKLSSIDLQDTRVSGVAIEYDLLD